MQTGLVEQGEARQYFTASYGRICKKATADDPKAVKHTSEKGEVSYTIEYRSIVGILENVKLDNHPEYGYSWVITFQTDAGEMNLRLQEKSRYGGDFAKRLPLLRRGELYVFTPYDFEPKDKPGTRKIGLNIKTETGETIPSYYQKWTEGDDTPENLNGYPEYEGNWKDKDETKIYFIRVDKFLREEGLKFIAKNFMGKDPLPQQKQEVVKPVKDEDLLPF